jgi:hypothetical protein
VEEPSGSRLIAGPIGGRAAPWWGWPALLGSLSGSASGGYLMESSRVSFVVDLHN